MSNKVMSFYNLTSLKPDKWIEKQDSQDIADIISEDILISEEQFDEDSDPLGLKGSLLKSVTPENKEFLLLSSENFNPQKFLRHFHSDTGFDDLLQGLEVLRFSVDQQAENMKELVKQNFDRFVEAKNTIDFVYKDMKKKIYKSDDYGTKNALNALDKANERFIGKHEPLLARLEQERRLRLQLSLISKYKSILSIPSNLEGLFEKGKYDQIVSDYRKIQEKMSNSPNSRHFEHIWETVDLIIKKVKIELRKNLLDTSLPIMTACNFILYLYELGVDTDPIDDFLETRLEASIASFSLSVEKVEAINLDFESFNESDNTIHLLKGIVSKSFDDPISTSGVYGILWSTILSSLEGILKETLASLNAFSNLCDIAADEMFKSYVKSGVTIKIRSTTSKIIASFTESLETIFKYSEFKDRIHLIPVLSSHCVTEVTKYFHSTFSALLVPLDWSEPLLKSFNSIQWTLLASSWKSVIEFCGKIHLSEAEMSHMDIFQALISNQLHASNYIMQVANCQEELPDVCVRLKKWFFDSIYSLLDSMEASEQESQEKVLQNLTSISYFKDEILFNLFNVFSNLFEELSLEKIEQVKEICKTLESRLVEIFIKSNLNHIKELVDFGLKFSSFDWKSDQTPKEIRKYVYQILLELVKVHKQISDVSQRLLKRLLVNLTYLVFKRILQNVQKIPSIGQLGVLQITLEAEFLQLTLSEYVTEEISNVATEILKTVQSVNYERKNVSQSTMDRMSAIVQEAQKNTQYQFQCFNE